MEIVIGTDENGDPFITSKSAIRNQAGINFEELPGNNPADEAARIRDENYDNQYAIALAAFNAIPENSQEAVKNITINGINGVGGIGPKPEVPPSLYDNLLAEISDLEETIETTVADEIQALGTVIETNVAGQLEDLIRAIGVETILTEQETYKVNFAQYQINKAAYDALTSEEQAASTAPVAPVAPATMRHNCRQQFRMATRPRRTLY